MIDALKAAVEAIVDVILSSVVTKIDLSEAVAELRRDMKAIAAELRGEISSAVNKMLLAQLAIAGLLFAALWILG